MCEAIKSKKSCGNDGRTLEYPQQAIKVSLAELDSRNAAHGTWYPKTIWLAKARTKQDLFDLVILGY